MTYAFVHDVPSSETIYAQIDELLPAEPPKGLIAHIVMTREGGLRFVDVWETEQDWERYRDDHVHPAVETVLARHGIAHDHSLAQFEEVRVIDAKVRAAPAVAA